MDLYHRQRLPGVSIGEGGELMRTLVLIAFVASAGGCAPGYDSGVRAVGDGSDLVTRVTAGFFGSTQGSLLRCRMVETRLQCAEVGTT